MYKNVPFLGPTTVPKTETQLVDLFNECPHYINLRGFDVGHCTGINDGYRLITKDDAMEWESSPWNCELTNGRRAYMSLRSPHNCIWWDKQFKHWWVGDCEKRGNNYGTAFLEPDEICPNHGKVGDWKRSGTSEILREGIIDEGISKENTSSSKLRLGKNDHLLVT